MSVLIAVVHIIVCLALIMTVLLQTGKGADMARYSAAQAARPSSAAPAAPPFWAN
jgi:preprotein translocase subunit SecG